MALNLDHLERLAAEWKSLQPLEPSRDERLWQKLRLEWNFHSNHIEGNTLTYGETAAFLLHDQVSGTHSGREYDEMKGHDLAIKLVRNLAASPQDLTEADVRNLNQIILKEPFYKDAVTPDGKPSRKLITPGRYKEEPNSVRTSTGELFEYASPMDVPPRMTKLVEAIRKCAGKDSLTFMAALAITHHEFTLIHPFDDGNGRTTRLITNYILLKKDLPPLVIPSEKKKDYLNALRQADGGDPTLLTDFFADQLVWSLDLAIKAAKGESLEEPSDIEKEIALFVREQERSQENPKGKNKEDFRRVWEESLSLILLKLEEKTRELGKLFSKREITLQVGIEFFSLAEGISKITHNIPTSLPERVEVSLEFEGYRAAPSDPFSIREWVTFRLEEYAYRILCQPEINLIFPYSKNPSPSEIDDITSKIIRRLFKEVKQKSLAPTPRGIPGGT